ncbi:MAG: 50S ribosomal protein L3 [Firmicutes bacterium]|nr:50S ribosomal protein L3 [Bacillota bacterium]
MAKAILGRKLGITQLFDEEGRLLPVTAIEAGPCRVVQVKTPERDGYAAVQLGFGSVKPRRVKKPMAGHFARHGVEPVRWLREVRVEEPGAFSSGQEVTVALFNRGDRVDVTGISKGKGFQGVIKRHGFRRGPMSHGSKYHRRVGSLGASTYPARVFKGRGMPGHMGARRATVQNLEVVRVEPERNLLLVKGSVPGAKGALLLIRSTNKMIPARA